MILGDARQTGSRGLAGCPNRAVVRHHAERTARERLVRGRDGAATPSASAGQGRKSSLSIDGLRRF
jgi:hypothetical protein